VNSGVAGWILVAEPRRLCRSDGRMRQHANG
jgi:hypothetical protein